MAITSAGATLEVLKLIGERPGLGLSELARIAELNKSRVYRILETLVDAGFVQQDGQGAYRLGVASLVLGQSARSQFDIVRLAESAVQPLAERFDENVQLRLRDGDEVVQVYARRSQQRLRVESSVGNRRALGRGASGRLLLAYAPAETRERLAREIEPPLTDAEIATIRDEGVARSSGELTAGVGAVAVPVIDAAGKCSACLSVSVPLARLDEDYARTLTAALQEAAAVVARHLPPAPRGV